MTLKGYDYLHLGTILTYQKSTLYTLSPKEYLNPNETFLGSDNHPSSNIIIHFFCFSVILFYILFFISINN